MEKAKAENAAAKDQVVTVGEGDLLEELASAKTVEQIKVIEAKAKATREVIASIGEQLGPFVPAATALAQALQAQVEHNSRLEAAAQKNQHELQLRAAQDAESEKIRQSSAQARLQVIGVSVFGLIVLVAVAMTVLVHTGFLDKTSALMVGVFLPVLWGAIKNMGK